MSMVRLTSVWRVPATASRSALAQSWGLVAIRIMFAILPVRVTLRRVDWGLLLEYSPGVCPQLTYEVLRRPKESVPV
jgi:hypothetical protein